MILLDTDLVTILLRGSAEEHRRLTDRLEARSDEVIATTIITYEEQTRGWLAYVARSKTMPQQIEAYRRLSEHLQHYRTIAVVGLNEPAAAEFQRPRQSRVRIGSMDLKIAAIALATEATPVTRNLGDFSKVPGLVAEDWTTGNGSEHEGMTFS